MPAHTIAAAILVDHGRVLLAHRHPQRAWYPNCWDLIGGHVEPGEVPLDALRRECREEIGITIDHAQPLLLSHRKDDVEIHPFVVRQWRGEVTNTAPDEHDDLRWYTAAELDGLPLADPDYLAVLTSVLEHDPRRG